MRVTWIELVNFLVVLILSTAFHEAAHAWLADRFGDDTPRRHGRLTLNPFPHLDPVMSVLVPGFLYAVSGGFVAAAWTPVNPWAMRDPRWHPVWTALGGPAANLVLGVAAMLALGVALAFGFAEAERIALLFVRVNVFLGVFNLIPVPPLDGANFVHAILPARWQPGFWELRRYGFIMLLALWYSGALDRTVFPLMDAAGREAVRASHAIGRMLGG